MQERTHIERPIVTAFASVLTVVFIVLPAYAGVMTVIALAMGLAPTASYTAAPLAFDVAATVVTGLFLAGLVVASYAVSPPGETQ